MKGLLIKDFRLMKTQSKFFAVLIFLAIFMAITTNEISFAVGYLIFVMPIFALSTVSYDEFDNGNAFLFTLPISRRGYVVEKYAFSALLAAIAWAFSAVLLLCVGAFGDMSASLEALRTSPLTVALMLVVLSVMLPIQFKFGAEKGRIALLILFGAVFLIGLAVLKIMEKLNFDILAFIDAVLPSTAVLIMDIAFLVIAAVGVSIAVSVGIMKKKQM